ncbi:MAG: hypothetical protein FK733_15270 [Asgard group archaeon]|nr:hypothetical protein [Asgard group archaeon]
MNKKLKILIPLLLASVLLAPMPVKGNYQQTAGQSFNYDIVKADLAVTYGGNSGNGSGFVLDGTQYGDGTQIEVYVLTVDPASSVSFDVSVGADSEVWATDLFAGIVWLALVMIYPIYLADGFGIMGDWGTIQPIVNEGLGLMMTPFWDTSYLAALEELVQPDSIDEFKTVTGMQDLTVKGKYDEKGGNVIFDWMMKGSAGFTGVYTADFDLEHQLKIVYDQTTGVLQGIRMLSSVVGTHSGTSMDVSLEYLQEIEGYNIDEFAFGLPGFGWIITIGTLGILAIPLIIRKNRKK